jgi:hypothetical protein
MLDVAITSSQAQKFRMGHDNINVEILVNEKCLILIEDWTTRRWNLRKFEIELPALTNLLVDVAVCCEVCIRSLDVAHLDKRLCPYILLEFMLLIKSNQLGAH